MFNPNKTWRRWHRRVNVNQRRYALTSALAASAIPALVMARGHKVEKIPELPLVLSNDIEGLSKTQKAVEVLKNVGVFEDVEKVKASRGIRRGQGKARNRRYVQRRGPLVIYSEDSGLVKAVRNIPGVDTVNVSRLNLLQLAPGGHLGRLCVWTQSAFERLDSLYGTQTKNSSEKTDYHLPRPVMNQADVARLINSDEVQSHLRAPKQPLRVQRKKNALRNLGVMNKLNPHAKTLRRAEIKKSASKNARKVLSPKKKLAIKAQKKTAYAQLKA